MIMPAGDAVERATTFESHYEEYRKLVFAIGLRMLREPSQAEDLVQATFLKVWARPEMFRGGDFCAWLSCVARNGALDVLRAGRVRTRVTLTAELLADDGMDERVISELEAHRVRDALQALPKHQRELITMGFFERHSYTEIAARARLPLGTVKTRIRSGLRRLRAALSE